ncbi:unnamed protein product [Mycena citricolor]|uniref:L-serine ammonia-lyase n=1 Tax=Mycena citricolor TaxID=2018698 RepID=A0AAD2HFM0_9AGAR|nr:unnamed protein product [Mycena citricolor]
MFRITRVKNALRVPRRLCQIPRRYSSSNDGGSEHAVISTFDLFSIGVGPSSSHTVGPMRAGKIFCADLEELNLLQKVHTVKITLYGSLAATGKGHHTPQAILLGLEGSDPETIDTGTIPSRYDTILTGKSLLLSGYHRIRYDMDRDMLWRWDQVLKTHPNGMRFSVFDENGDLLATNEYFSVGGGFVVNDKTKVDENLFYKGVDKKAVHGARLHQVHAPVDSDAAPLPEPSPEGSEDPIAEHVVEPGPPYPFASGNDLLELTKKHNMTIAQIVWDNERSFGYSDEEVHAKLMRIWSVMDECIRTGVSTSETTLPGRLRLRRRAPMLYRRLMRGFYPGISGTAMINPVISSGSAGWRPDSAIDSPRDSTDPTAGLPKHSDEPLPVRPSGSRAARVVGSFEHAVLPMPPRRTVIPAMDFLSCYAIAVNEVNAGGGRIVTSPTNGAAGVIPAVLKYIIEFVSDDPEKSVITFLLTASVRTGSEHVLYLSSSLGRLSECCSNEGVRSLLPRADAKQRLESRVRWPVLDLLLVWAVGVLCSDWLITLTFYQMKPPPRLCSRCV